MTYRGTVRKGVIVLDGGVTLNEGTMVEVHPVRSPSQGIDGRDAAQPTIWEKLAATSGRVTGLPPDAARNMDDYLYDTPQGEE